jgi:hypothetical protein
LLGQYQAGQVGALSPFQTSLGLGGTIEQMGQQGLEIGSALGGKSATAGANVGQALLSGGMSAAKTAQAANAYNPLANVLQGIGSNPYLAQGAGRGISSFYDGIVNPYTVDTSGAGMGSWGTVDTGSLAPGSFR